MNDEEIIEAKIARYMAEGGGDPRLAMRLMAIDLHRMGASISHGLLGIPPLARSGFSLKPKAPSIDDPLPEEATPS